MTTSAAVDNFASRIFAFSTLLQKEQIERLHLNGITCDAILASRNTKIIPGKKYWKVDCGGSGKYMVEVETEIIYGIKGYGVIHKGHAFGTLSTTHLWNWGNYRGVKLPSLPTV